MPAAFFWRPMTPETDGSFSSAVANNWRTGPAATAPVYTVAPGWEDDLYFQGDVSVVNCTIPDMPTPTNSAGLTFNSINLLFGVPLTPEPGPIGSPPPTPTPTPYTGIVTIKDSFAIGTLVVDTGAISQADPAWLIPPIPYAPHAGTLTITTALDWTGGTLNSNTTAGYIDLAPGSISTAEPSFTNGMNGTVYLGSTLTLKGTDPELTTPGLGSILSMIGGTFEVNNNASIVAAAFSTLLIQAADKPAEPGSPPPPVPVKSIIIDRKDVTPNDGVVKIDPKSNCVVDRPPNTTGPAVFELKGKEAKFTNNGTTRIQGLTEVRITDPERNTYPYEQNDANAVTELQGGSSITSNGNTNVNIVKGVLEILERRVNDTPTFAKIAVSNVGAGNALVIRQDATLKMSTAYSRLEVDSGDLSIYGTLAVVINPRGVHASLIDAKKWMHFHEVPGEYKAKLSVTHQSIGNGDQLPVNTKWTVATAAGVGGTPDMTQNSTDYTTDVPISGDVLKVKRIN